MVFNFVSDERFRRPVTTIELEEFGRSWAADNSRRKWCWVLRVFEDWRKARNKLVLKDPYLGEPVYEKALSSMSDEELDDVLGKFVAEVRKEGQEEYPGKTLYEMICCIQAYFRIECKRNITLVDKKGCNFRNLNSALNFQMKQRASAGVGVDVKQAKVISESDENYLWEHGYLGNVNPEVLRNTLVWVLGLNFALRAGQEHRNLRMKNSQLSVAIDEDGKQYLEYKEDVSKTNSGGLAHAHLKRKIVRAYENNDEPERCPVRLYKEYMAHVPKDAPANSFYLRPLKEPKGNIWYYKVAAGRETLGNVVAQVMKSASFEGYYTNHSLRRTCATRLYDKGLPEQLIQETTGHRSADGVRCYKRTSSCAKRRASEIVQGSLKEEDITCKVIKQENEENEGEGEISETKEEENKIIVSTKNTNIVINYR